MSHSFSFFTKSVIDIFLTFSPTPFFSPSMYHFLMCHVLSSSRAFAHAVSSFQNTFPAFFTFQNPPLSFKTQFKCHILWDISIFFSIKIFFFHLMFPQYILFCFTLKVIAIHPSPTLGWKFFDVNHVLESFVLYQVWAYARSLVEFYVLVLGKLGQYIFFFPKNCFTYL